MHIEIEIANGTSVYSAECRFSMFGLKRACMKIADSIAESSEILGVNAADILGFVPLLKLIASLIGLIHAMIAALIALFGVGGFFSFRIHSMFSKPCGTALLIETYTAAVIGIVVGLYLRDMMGYINTGLSFSLSVVFGIELWLLVELFFSAVFVLTACSDNG